MVVRSRDYQNFSRLLVTIFSKPWCSAERTSRARELRYKHLESLPDTSSQIFDWKQFAIHSFSLFGGIRFSQNNKTSESTASLSLAERWANTEIRRQLNSVLTYYLLTDVLL